MSERNRRGWVRESRHHSAKSQIAALKAAEFDPIYVYVHEQCEITDFITALRPGDTVGVTTFGRLGSNRDSLREVDAAIRARQCVIIEVKTGRRSDNPTDATAMAFDAADELGRDARALTKRQAKEIGAMGMAARIAKAEASRMPKDQAREIWLNYANKTNEECLEMMTGWTSKMAYHHIGTRGLAKGRPIVRDPNAPPPRMRVYFVQEGGDDSGPVKIGTTRHVVKRMNGLAHPLRGLRLLASIDGGFGAEKEMHQRFAKYRIKGEWFTFRGELKKFVTALQKQQRDEPH